MFGEPPFVLAGDEFFLEAYWELNTCRYIPNGPVPWTAIMEFARFSQLSPDIVPMFVRAVRAFDVAFLEWREKKLESKSG